MSPASPPNPPSRDAVEGRIATLRSELEEATGDRARQAVLQYEIGHLLERQLGNDAGAVKEYLAAFNLDPAFRPPLFALVRVFERRRSFKNLARLYETEERSATTPGDRSSAMLDRAVLLEDHLGQDADARALFEQAMEADPTSQSAALMLERAAWKAADKVTAERAISTRADLVEDSVLKGVLLVETAWAREAEGDVGGALAAIREAATLPAARWRFLEQLERIARKHDRVPDLIHALEGRAQLAGAAARGEDAGQGSGVFSLSKFADSGRANVQSAALWYEAARLRLSRLGDAAGAQKALAQALAVRPDDVLIRQEHMLAAEMAGDLDSAAEDARALLSQGISGRWAAALHFRLAEVAQAREDRAGAREALAAALEADPSSAVAAAMLEDLLLDEGLHEERVARFETRAQVAPPEVQSRLLWRAAQIAAEQLRDVERAKVLYNAALAAATTANQDRTPILRELYGVAVRFGLPDAAREAGAQLLELPIDDLERSALLRDLIELARWVLDDATGAEDLLRTALRSDAAVKWAPDAARAHAAATGDTRLLADAHRALAERATDPETAAAHLCAAARALVRGKDEEGAMLLLRRALERAPGHRYAVGLLEEILRSRGAAEEVVTLLRESAAAQEGARAIETSLLLAGAAAEAAGDPALAAKTYEEAADRDAAAVGALWALRRLAERTKNEAMLLRAREKLSERELAAGSPSRSTLELGEHYELIARKPQLAEMAFKATLESTVGTVGAVSAVALALAPMGAIDRGVRRAAAEKLAADADPGAKTKLLRELVAAAAASGDDARAQSALEEILTIDPDDRAALLTRWRRAIAQPEADGARSDAWTALAGATRDPAASADLALHGLRARIAAEGADALVDGFMTAQEIADSAPGTAAGAVAVDETVAAGDDPESRANALAGRLAHGSAKGSTELMSAHGRALVAAGRSEEAVPVLRKVLGLDASDLAAWDALRIAARETKAWEEEVKACDKLAALAEGTHRAELLEEAAAVLMDEMEDDAGAEQRLRQALKIDARRPIAYHRLRDLFAERDDGAGQLELVQARIDVVDDSDELNALFYEQARLLRSLGDREAALSALENLLMLEPSHVGGLALQVEIQVSLERWQQAVESLRQLASADVPVSQKRLAHLGAADFLEKKLGDPGAALVELGEIEKLGLADASLYQRMADVAERASVWEAAVVALDRAIQITEGSTRAEHARRLGRIHREKRRDTAAAVAAHEIALAAQSDDAIAAGALADMLVDPVERAEMLAGFEGAVRWSIERDPTDADALRKLRDVARWRGDRHLEALVLDALVAIGAATAKEQSELDERREVLGRLPSGVLGEPGIAQLRATGDGGPWAQVTDLICEAVAEMDRLEPAAFGAGKPDLVSPKTPHAVRNDVMMLARVFGVPVGDFYQGGREPGLVAVLPRDREKPQWIVGTGVGSPLPPLRRWQVGRAAIGARTGSTAFLDRSDDDAATLLLAATIAAEAPLPAAAGRPGIEELARALNKAMSRKVRKAIPDVIRGLPDGGRGVGEYVTAAKRTAMRAGLLLAGDLGAALEAVLGYRASTEAVRGSADARDLVTFWISPAAIGLRRDLGLG